MISYDDIKITSCLQIKLTKKFTLKVDLKNTHDSYNSAAERSESFLLEDLSSFN